MVVLTVIVYFVAVWKVILQGRIGKINVRKDKGLEVACVLPATGASNKANRHCPPPPPSATILPSDKIKLIPVRHPVPVGMCRGHFRSGCTVLAFA